MAEQDPVFARVVWGIGDILELRPDWSPERAADFLANNEKYIVDAMVERGWDAIETLLLMDEAGR